MKQTIFNLRYKKAIKLFVILTLATCSSNASGQSAFFEKLIGSWEGRGQLLGNRASFQMAWEMVLDGQFARLDFKNESFQPDSSSMVFKAIGLYNISSDSITGTWSDSRGVTLNLSGSIDGNTLRIDWHKEGFEEGYTLYRLTGQHQMEVKDFVKRNGAMVQFGQALYRRVSPTQVRDQPGIVGIGGIFFTAKAPEQLRKWYREMLGIINGPQGGSFVWRKFDDPQQFGFTTWHAYEENSSYFEGTDRPFMINYRVNRLDDFLKILKKKGVQTTGPVETFPFGRFVKLMDPEGNKIELWEPNESLFLRMMKDGPEGKFNISK